jgi:hypothetical protein
MQQRFFGTIRSGAYPADPELLISERGGPCSLQPHFTQTSPIQSAALSRFFVPERDSANRYGENKNLFQSEWRREGEYARETDHHEQLIRRHLQPAVTV